MTAAAPAPAARPGRRPDESMTLLREVMERPLDPGYAHARAHPRPRSRRRAAVTIVLAVLGGYLLAVSVVYARLPQPQAARTADRLRAEITARSAEVERQEQANTALRAGIAATQRAALAAAGGSALAERVESLGLVTGELAVTGPGVRFTIQDAPNAQQQQLAGDPRAVAGTDAGIVLDADLRVVVNGLWAAGAEAISINGERLTALSAIRSAGQAILVDFRPLAPPYVIDAIGDETSLQTRFAAGTAGPYVQSMRDNNGIRVDLTPQRMLRLPGASQLMLRSARAEPVSTGPARTP